MTRRLGFASLGCARDGDAEAFDSQGHNYDTDDESLYLPPGC
jgi:hypothetical protein